MISTDVFGYEGTKRHLRGVGDPGVRQSGMTARQAAAKLGITRQYANRLRKAYAEEGPPCLRHGNSGRTSPLRTDPETGGGRSTSRAQITPGDSTRSRSNQVETNNVIMTALVLDKNARPALTNGYLLPVLFAQLIKNADTTALILYGGGAEIRTLAGAEPHYRFSRPTPSAAWVRLLTKMVVHRWLEHRT